jgi:tellurite methyltransferase
MSDSDLPDPPSGFVMGWAARLEPALPHPCRVLDVAMGRGRHALSLAQRGCVVFGVDRRLDALRDALTRARASGVRLHVWCADLTEYPLPSRAFDLLIVTRYLQRDLSAALADALVPGGVLLYETFTEKQRALGRGPTSPDHLLAPGELRAAFPDLEILHFEEVDGPDAVARLAARRT